MAAWVGVLALLFTGHWILALIVAALAIMED